MKNRSLVALIPAAFVAVAMVTIAGDAAAGLDANVGLAVAGMHAVPNDPANRSCLVSYYASMSNNCGRKVTVQLNVPTDRDEVTQYGLANVRAAPAGAGPVASCRILKVNAYVTSFTSGPVATSWGSYRDQTLDLGGAAPMFGGPQPAYISCDLDAGAILHNVKIWHG
ncbi:hypothetical protein BH11MYX4_BH11MYX4_58060 [soil metagenome]